MGVVFFVCEERAIIRGTVYFEVVIKGGERISGATLLCPIDLFSILTGFGSQEREDLCVESISVCIISDIRRCDVFCRVESIELPEGELTDPCSGIKMVVKHAKNAALNGSFKVRVSLMATIISTVTGCHLSCLAVGGANFAAPFSIVEIWSSCSAQGKPLTVCQARTPYMQPWIIFPK